MYNETHLLSNFLQSERELLICRWLNTFVSLFQVSAAVALASLFHALLGAFGVIGALSNFIGPVTVATMLAGMSIDIVGPITKTAAHHWGIAIL